MSITTKGTQRFRTAVWAVGLTTAALSTTAALAEPAPGAPSAVQAPAPGAPSAVETQAPSAPSAAAAPAPAAPVFATPEAAGEALIGAARKHDVQALARLFGPGSRAIVSSGDPVADHRVLDRFLAEYDQKHVWVDDGPDRRTLQAGDDGWPLPVPLVKNADGWHFDGRLGREEIINRRIGRNELGAIQACLAFVDAEKEYYDRNPTGGAHRQYAQFIASSAGKKDGLHWETAAGEPPSPLGPLFVSARAEGYEPGQGKAMPYHGYLYRILKAQGPDAPGGAYDYVVDGEMTRGFALIASPARWGASGVTTFLVSHAGVVYEKDLGPDTAAAAAAISVFDPDDTWTVVPKDDLQPPETPGGA